MCLYCHSGAGFTLIAGSLYNRNKAVTYRRSIRMEVFLAVCSFVLIVTLTFLNGYYIIVLDELELDHLNPADVAKRLNKLAYPEMILHATLLLVSLIAWSPFLFLLSIPIACWHVRRLMRVEHLIDPTEILRFKKLQSARMESIVRTIFYGLLIIYAMFWMVTLIVNTSKEHVGSHS
uniref:Uncharacterized protein AlNc14C72G4902 n=1 Tax=Albugo laibachii Nc14 TaxID=890382 RepID=F0WE41_9STRA|nr:conserved hypothetical protein [Albugo laibachii Nc14]|eukprot:CCA19470.1 conserved hypothetical protein [Albugo laibachii Nc14]